MKLKWKRLFRLDSDELLGLDVGSTQVKLVQLGKDNGNYTVIAAGLIGINQSKDDAEQRQKSAVDAIRNCLRASGASTRMAVCGLCGPEVAVRHFRFPPLPPEEIDGAVQLEAVQVCPFSVEESTVDYQLVSDGDESIRGVLVAATNSTINARKQLAEEASLRCVLMDIDGLALLNCFTELYQGEDSAQSGKECPAILNVGSSYTTLAIVGSDKLPFVRDIAYAGNNIIAEISTQMGLESQQVLTLLTEKGAGTEMDPMLRQSLATACYSLITDVSETLRFYSAGDKAVAVRKIYLCGGFSMVNGFVDLLGESLSAEVVLWNPFEKIRCRAGQDVKKLLSEKGPALAVAAGLAVRSI